MDNHVFNPPASIPTAENNEPNLTTQAVVSVRNLQLPSGAIAPNIWLERKEQPALASVSLWLRNSFTSAASQDALDDSTVHYGELSKRVRAGCTGEEGQRSALEAVFQAAEHMARKPKPDGDNFVAKRIVAKVTLPKASAFGDALTLSEVKTYDAKGSKTGGFRTFACKNLKVPTLIGVNAYERKGRQPLVVDFALDFDGESYESLSSEQHMDVLFPIERELVDVSALNFIRMQGMCMMLMRLQIVEKTDFETLETLVEHTFNKLRSVFERRSVKPSVVHLRFEKPCAVPFADGPVIEVHQRWA
jgi:dihydroneopterin aldolase